MDQKCEFWDGKYVIRRGILLWIQILENKIGIEFQKSKRSMFLKSSANCFDNFSEIFDVDIIILKISKSIFQNATWG